MPPNKDFFASVYDVVKLIPIGRVTSYGAIGKYLGSTRSAQMVGWAMSASHMHRDIPAHRVVNRRGVLTGKMHFIPPESMKEKLQSEGIRVENDQIVDFDRHFWDPTKELL